MSEDAETRATQLDAAREETARTRDLLNEARTESERRKQLIEEQFSTIGTLESESERLARETAGLREQLETLTGELSTARIGLAAATNSLQGTQMELESLREDYRARDEELQAARQQVSVTDRRLAELQGDFDDLQVKYDKLVKPARSAANKHVVEVRYFKSDGKYRIQYREPGDSGFRDISRAEMDRRLLGLSEEMPDRLYVRVIIPDDSGLSYSEAWQFTSHVHNSYDYYFRGPEEER